MLMTLGIIWIIGFVFNSIVGYKLSQMFNDPLLRSGYAYLVYFAFGPVMTIMILSKFLKFALGKDKNNGQR